MSLSRMKRGISDNYARMTGINWDCHRQKRPVSPAHRLMAANHSLILCPFYLKPLQQTWSLVMFWPHLMPYSPSSLLCSHIGFPSVPPMSQTLIYRYCLCPEHASHPSFTRLLPSFLRLLLEIPLQDGLLRLLWVAYHGYYFFPSNYQYAR